MAVVELLRRAVHGVAYVSVLHVGVCAQSRNELVDYLSVYVSVGLYGVVAVVFVVGTEYHSAVMILLPVVLRPYVGTSCPQHFAEVVAVIPVPSASDDGRQTVVVVVVG